MVAIEHCETVARNPQSRHAGCSFAIRRLIFGRRFRIVRHRVQLVQRVVQVGGPCHDQHRVLGRVVRNAASKEKIWKKTLIGDFCATKKSDLPVHRSARVATELNESCVFARGQIQAPQNALLDVEQEISVQTVCRSLTLQLVDDHAGVVSCGE